MICCLARLKLDSSVATYLNSSSLSNFLGFFGQQSQIHVPMGRGAFALGALPCCGILGAELLLSTGGGIPSFDLAAIASDVNALGDKRSEL